MDSVTEFIRNGEKGKQTGQIGLEVEHFLLNRQTGRPMEYDEIARLLEELAPLYCTSVYEQGNRISLENHWTLITLEPGCQLELSFRCTPDLKKIEEKYRQAIAPIREYADKKGYDIVYSGGLPTVAADQVRRIEKERYRLMEEWFKTSGTRGLEMMKATAAVHVSVDYADEQDFVKKVRLANILHPLLMFLSFHTPVYAGKKNEDVLLRDSIWQHTDPARCRIIEDLFAPSFGYQSYADYVMNTPMILMHDEDDYISVGDQTGKQVAQRYGYSQDAVAHYLSMVFPDVRVKQFIEIRSADSMPIEETMAYCAFLKGLFYQPEIVEKYQSLCHRIEQIEQAKQNIRADRWQAQIYQRPLRALALELVQEAEKGLSDAERPLLERLEQRIKACRFVGENHEAGERV
ncbi:MAG: hypothetical protein J6D18_02015 [Erysipelotrichaceae bacterium]|nr:hypothetical protein [Erysipelotrichaceae bacterium]